MGAGCRTAVMQYQWSAENRNVTEGEFDGAVQYGDALGVGARRRVTVEVGHAHAAKANGGDAQALPSKRAGGE